MITIKDIAREAGVSIGTVDRVLHGRGRVSAETAAKVRALVQEHGYTTDVFGRNLVSSKTHTIGVVLPHFDQESGYWQLVAQGAAKAEEELRRQRIVVKTGTFDRYSPAPFAELSPKLRTQTLDGLVVAPVAPSLAEPFVLSLNNAIPYVFVDSTVSATHPLTVIGQDSYQSGVLAAALFGKTIPKSGSIAVIRICPDNPHICKRASGLLSALPSRLRAVVYDVAAPVTEDSVREMVAKACSDLSDLVGVFVTNVLAHFAADYLVSIGEGGSIRLIGYDAVEKNAPYLRNGTIDFVISQRPVQQGYLAVYALYRKLVLNQQGDETIHMPLDIVTAENIDYYL
jgi:LacI family transcriptional regulator